jgi:hypothetical protein
MHYQAEIILPPQYDIKDAIAEIMEPFSEHDDDKRNCFWDFFVIGGRWSGSKLMATLDQDKVKEFHDQLQKLEITCSGFRAGKHELNPPEQIPIVDNLWNEYFPETKQKHCPLFKHSNDQYDSDDLILGDIMKFSDIPMDMKFSRVIFCYERYDQIIEASEMFTDEIWNGVTREKTVWDRTFKHAIELFNEKINRGYNEKHIKKITPKDDWNVVTVDYHS